MPNGIEIKFCLGQQTAIQLSHQDCFIFKVRASQKFTKRTDDAASAAGKNSVLFCSEGRGVIFGEVATAVDLIAAQDKAAAFRGNMLHGGRPGSAMIGGWRAINLNALG